MAAGVSSGFFVSGGQIQSGIEEEVAAFFVDYFEGQPGADPFLQKKELIEQIQKRKKEILQYRMNLEKSKLFPSSLLSIICKVIAVQLTDKAKVEEKEIRISLKTVKRVSLKREIKKEVLHIWERALFSDISPCVIL